MSTDRPRGRDPGRGRTACSRTLWAGGPRGLRGRWVAARHDARPPGGGLGPRHRRAAGTDARAVPGRRLREQVRDRRGPDRRPGRRRGRDHDLPLRPRLRRLPPAAPGRVRRRRSSSICARRDFTVNAMAWGAEPGEPPRLVDPHGGQADLAARTLRTVGDPDERFEEDALRMVRAVRLAATLDFDIEPGDAGRDPRKGPPRSPPVRRAHRDRDDGRLLAAERPSVGLRLMADTGLLAAISPELAAPTGRAQNKVPGEDLWDHTLRAVDGAATEPPRIRLAALLHDIGKPATMADGRFLGHETVGCGARPTGCSSNWRWPRGGAPADRGPRSPPHVRLPADLVGRRRPPVHRQGQARTPRGPVPPARGGPHRLRARARCRWARRAPGARRGATGRGGGARPAAGWRWTART